MELVRVSQRSSWTAPKSLMVYRNTSSAPAQTAPAVCGARHRRNTAAGLRPSRRALSSSDAGSWPRRAATGSTRTGR